MIWLGSGGEHGPEQVLHGLPVTLGGRLVVSGVVGHGEAVVRWIGFDRVGDASLGQALFEEVLLLVGKGLVLDGAGDVDRGLDGAGLLVRAIGVVVLGDVAAMERGGCRRSAHRDCRPP